MDDDTTKRLAARWLEMPWPKEGTTVPDPTTPDPLTAAAERAREELEAIAADVIADAVLEERWPRASEFVDALLSAGYVATPPPVEDPTLTAKQVERLTELFTFGTEGREAKRTDIDRMRTALAVIGVAIAEPAEQCSGAALIAAERHRVVTVKGYTPEHDAQHVHGELLDAARCYANQGRTWFQEHASKYGTDRFSMDDQGWPWWTGDEPLPQGWKPSADPIENLTKAGQFIAAEIDRLRRAEADHAG